MTNSYEERQQARKDRLEARALKARGESDQAYRSARGSIDCIPPGQPILVDHYSAPRHRAALRRHDNQMRRSIEADKKADYYANKAAAVGTGGISSDDPQAIEKLRAQVADLTHKQEAMKKANAIIRSRRDATAKTAELVALGFAESEAAELQNPNSSRGIGFPSYRLTNNNANIRRIEQRIRDLEALAARAPVEVEGKGYVYRECSEENRVMFIFDAKPDANVRARLKKSGFRWSPGRDGQPWVRVLTGNAIYDGREARKWLDEYVNNQSSDN